MENQYVDMELCYHKENSIKMGQDDRLVRDVMVVVN